MLGTAGSLSREAVVGEEPFDFEHVRHPPDLHFCCLRRPSRLQAHHERSIGSELFQCSAMHE
jgi:hypothetical protein